MEMRNMTKEQLNEFLTGCKSEYDGYKAKGLNLDMSRGKPGADQLDLSNEIFNIELANGKAKASNGFDCRNYGILDGIPDMKKIFAELLEVAENEVIVGGNSSLNMMYDTILRAMQFGVLGSDKPWSKYETVKFLCPVPGYDRHFAITERMGFEMINIPMTEAGPDMDMVEELVANDESIKGIWCVPKYSNPDGITYSDETVKRFASMKTKANDFRIIWDNAYCVHDLNATTEPLLNILDECKKAGNDNRVFVFSSTSKITFPGAGVAVMAASKANIDFIQKDLTLQTIGSDKVNQLRHAIFLKDAAGVKAHMQKHRAILEPKFDVVLDMLQKEIAPLDIASWHKPKGGYFVSFNTLDGVAKRVGELCKEAGVVLTSVGATFPYGKDPADKNIRIAPTFPPVSELVEAMNLFCVCVKIATCEKLLQD